MKKLAILVLILILILAGLVTLMAANSGNSDKNLPYTHSHTKAICNSENFCQDYEIFCKKQEVIKISPITGAFVQFSQDWQDPRSEEMRSKFC